MAKGMLVGAPTSCPMAPGVGVGAGGAVVCMSMPPPPPPRLITHARRPSNHSLLVAGAERRSAHYGPPAWDADRFLHSLAAAAKTPEMESGGRQRELIKVVEGMVEKEEEEGGPWGGLELLDLLHRLGVSRHFQHQIRAILNRVHEHIIMGHLLHDPYGGPNLYLTALAFRLLRHHGYHVSQDIFNIFKDTTGNLDTRICEDVKGLLALYEASFLLFQGDSLLEMAKDFTTKLLKLHVDKCKMNGMNEGFVTLATHALELPLHWRMPRLETRWFIQFYQNTPDAHPTLLELAKLDFNMVQLTHHHELTDALRWWKGASLDKILPFARDRLLENFWWAIGEMHEPKFGRFRIMSSRLNALITTIDDVYDVYGTLDELRIFTDVVSRWDSNALEKLPFYMRICFLQIFNFIHDTSYVILKAHNILAISHLKKAWEDLCKAYLLEAEWHNKGYIPTLHEYMENAWISIGAPTILIHAYFYTEPADKGRLELLDAYPSIIQWSSTILRLSNDLGTSPDELKRGDVPKSVQCYMNQVRITEEDARKHLAHLIFETWMKLNEASQGDAQFSRTFIRVASNLARMALCVYQYGDGHGNNKYNISRDHLMSMMFDVC